jgi:4a-hydroxytetrahydrobiopterin dehydratase
MSRTPPPKYDQAAAEAKRERELPDWLIDGDFLTRTYAVHGWKSALLVANTVGHLCEAAWHHADLAISYGKVTVRLQTHESKGITDRDFELARKIEEVVGWRPGKLGGALEGTPDDERYAYIKH